METYNKIILGIWWSIAILSSIIITIMGFIQGFDRWAEYYVFTGLAFFIIFVRRYTSKKVYPSDKSTGETKKK